MSTGCSITGVTINGDINGRLQKSVEHVANGEKQKLLMLASYLNSQEFLDYCLKDELYDKTKSLAENNANIVRRLLRTYHLKKNINAYDRRAREQAQSLMGFSTSSALRTGVNFTTSLVLNTHYKNNILAKRKKERLNKVNVIKKVIAGIKKEYIKKCITPLVATVKNKENNTLVIDCENALEAYDNLFKTPYYEGKEYDYLNAERELLSAAYELIETYGTIIQKNFRTIVEHVICNPKEWFTKVFTNSQLTHLVKDYNYVLESDKLYDVNFQDENDFINEDADDTDQMSKSWEDKEWASFDKSVAEDLKVYFASLYKLKSPASLTDDSFDFDTDNECGVPTTMGANFILQQLINGISNFNSIDEFIDDIVKLSQQIPECYGLIQIAKKANEDPEFANYLMVNLGNPKVNKTVITILENGIDVTQSNKASDAITYVIFRMINAANSVAKYSFDNKDIEVLNKLLKQVIKKKDGYYSDENNLNEKVELIDSLSNILRKYYPDFTKSVLENALFKKDEYNNLTTKQRTKDLIDKLIRLNEKIQQINETRNNLISEHNNKVKDWLKRRRFAISIDESFNEPMPIMDWTALDTSKLNEPVIEIAKQLVNYTAVKNSLNSVNAEGKQSSDITYNNYITNLFRQIAFDPDNKSQEGLQKLLNEVQKGEQYRYNTLFWGVQDGKGKYIQEGLFMRKPDGTAYINPNAKQILNYSLFNGTKLFDNSKSVMYSKMSKGDYFFTAMLAYYNPQNIGTALNISKSKLEDKYAGYLMRTPSDAPKNFIIQAPKLKADSKELLSPIQEDVTAYINKKIQELNSYINKSNAYEDWEDANMLKLPKNNIWSVDKIYELLSGKLDIINYNKLNIIDHNDGTISIPIIYSTENTTNIFWVKGTKLLNETNNILVDFSIESITPFVGFDSISKEFMSDIKDYIIQEGIQNGEIKTKVNTNIEIFSALKQQLKGELNTFIDQLNNLFIKDKNGNWVLRKDTLNLIDRAHYNGELIKDDKLTGNFFKFKKLFDTNGVNMQEVIEQMFSLYGQVNEALINVSRGSATINKNNSLVSEYNGRLILNITDETLNDKLNEIVSLWINNFNREVIEKSRQFNKLLENTENYDVLAFALNYANTYMSFDDIFEGDVKFYKDSQDFLKRAKEVQAGGSLYTGYNFSDEFSSVIKDCVNKNGQNYKITVAGVGIDEFLKAYSPVKIITSPNARNGFRAITIYNTVRPSKNADAIENELFNILKEQMSDKEAKRIAVKVANGYRQNTKTNDAQSYITLEEFIRRRYADGTLNQYQDILTQIYEVRTGKRDIKDLDISDINARIQVQKNFYFDKHFDQTTKTFYPRQIKNAEFVIIPELVKGTDLETLYNIMTKYDIGQVNTAEASKAAKRNVLTFWDNEGNVNANEFEKSVIANGQTSVENYYYRYLYKQQEVPEHMKDQANKAGVQIMKKILDNANDSVKPYVKKFFDNYCANIKEDFNRLLFNMGWKVNKDGNLSNIDDTKPTLDFTEFYKRARHEAQRLGLDENFVDFLTPDELGDPIMPNYMNNVTSKLESIAQAIFNRSITRQTLPGWHAAQVTQVGHGTKVLDSEGKLRELKYHPQVIDENGNVKQEAYAEVLIPRWSNLIPKEDNIIEKLEKEGLDMQIAYRIPTEGKQSVSVIKVVGFLDDVYGSTIMLPDEWVTQTGADFDIDSVYAISHQIKKDKKTGNIIKWSKDTLKDDFAKYVRYITENLKDKKEYEDVDIDGTNIYNQYLKQVKEAYKNKDEKAISNIAKKVGLYTFSDFESLDEVDKLPREVRDNEILDAIIAIMEDPNSREENFSRSNFENLIDAKNHCDDLRGASSVTRSSYNVFDQIDFFENAMSGAALKAFSVTRDTFNSVNNYIKSQLTKEHEILVEYDLNEYNKEILEAAYGEDVDFTTKKGYAIVKHRKLGHSNNNRNVRGELITVYSSQTTAHILDAIKEGGIYNENMYTFGTFKTLIDLGIDYETAIVFLMQPAITEINGVNNETNSVYLNSGGNAIQVAIKRIASKAGYILNGNPIQDYSNYEDVINLLSKDSKFINAVKELFGVELSDKIKLDNIKVALNKTMLENRLKSTEITNNSELSDKDKQIKDAAFDIVMALMFDKFHNTTSNIEKIMRCTNPDKFGAKQTIRSTRIIKNNAIVYGWDLNNDVTKTITVNGKPLLQALYPGFVESYDEDGVVFGDIDIKNSAYPYLAAFFKYSTLSSIEANSLLFPTENDIFNNILDAVQRKMGIVFTDEQYKEYKQYMMSHLYSGIASLYKPTKVTKEGYFEEDIDRVSEYSKNNISYWNAERSRIFGYEEIESLFLEIKDFDNPTEEELNTWYKFTPAQKVMWLIMNIDTSKSIFKYLEVNLNNQRELNDKGYSAQTIKFNESTELMEEIYSAFNDSAFNKNILIRSAVYDLVKYAFIVEGFKFKRGGLSKVITNKFLYSSIDELGTAIISDIRTAFTFYANEKEAVTTSFIDKFIRSHSEYVRTIRLDRASKNNEPLNLTSKFNIYSQGNDAGGLIFIPFEKRAEDVLDVLNVSKESDNTIYKYIRLNKLIGRNNRKITLYKIRKTDRGVYLIPMNLLERNEVADYSVNNENNKFADLKYYETLINLAETNAVDAKVISKDEKYVDVLDRKNNIIPKFKSTRRTITEDIDYLDRLSKYGSPINKASANKFIEQLIDVINSPVEGEQDTTIFSSDYNISKHIPVGSEAVQKITIDGEKVYVNIKAIRKPSLKVRQAAKDAGMEFAKYYKISRVFEADIIDKNKEIDEAHKEKVSREMHAITSDISEYIAEESDAIDIVDSTMHELLNEVKRAERNGDENAAKLRKNLQLQQIRENVFQDLVDHRKNIYEALAQYIEVRARNLNRLIENYKFNDDTYNLGQKELYEALRDNHEEAENIVRLLLESITFADTFGNVMTLPFDGLDDDTKRAIQRIRNAIVSVRSNRHVKAGFDLMFNHYIANEYATNPNVRLGLVDLKDAFGDSGWFEKNIGDTAMISNKQIQTIVSLVNSIMTKATQIDAPARRREFLKKVADIESRSGSFNWDNIIDAQGRLRRPYTQQFIDDRNKLNEAIQFAKETYGENSLEHIKAKLERDKWYAKNVHQIVIKPYYDKKNELIKEVISNAPIEYVEYVKLQKELYGNKKLGLITEEERARRKEIQAKINQLLSDYKEDKTLKDDDEQFRAGRLRYFINSMKSLNDDYFEFKESLGFRESLTGYLQEIENHELAHPNMPLKQRLEDPKYREAYEWIKNNSYYSIDKEGRKKLDDAYKTLGTKEAFESKKNSHIRDFLKSKDAYDIFGNIDPSKLTKEDIEHIRQISLEKYKMSYDSAAGDAVLIKDAPAALPVLKDEFYRMLRDPSENEAGVNSRRLALYKTINDILRKVVDKNGHISTKLVFEVLTEDERETLAKSYEELRTIKGKRKPKEIRKRFKANVEFKTNNVPFNTEFAYAKMNLRSDDYQMWLRIFAETDSETGNIIPNKSMYDYIAPKDNKYIDKDKTAARDLIENNVEYVPTQYYFDEINKQTEAGTFEEWYELNHIYNPYTKKYEPLRIWTKEHINPNGSLKGSYSYVPTNEYAERSVKEEYINPNYGTTPLNYNVEGDDSYFNKLSLTEKERDMLDLLEDTMNFFAKYNHNNKRFIEEGFIPRKYHQHMDTEFYIKQGLGIVGLEWRNDSEDRYYDKVDYVNDHELSNDMLRFLKGKGYQQREPIRTRSFGESEEEYKKYVEETKKKNEEIRNNNIKIDNALFDKDYKTAFADAIEQQVILNARSKAKNWLYLLQEDLKNNEAYKVSALSGKLIKDKERSTDAYDRYATVSQDNSLEAVNTFTRRVIYDQFKKKTKFNKFGDLLKNITSAKYMIFNVTGGIANVGTGFTNIMGEAFAGSAFTKEDIAKAVGMYTTNAVHMLADLYKDSSQNFATALTKYFDVVDFDAMAERTSGESVGDYIRRVRNGLYGLQSSGEHFMQNSVLFAVLMQNRLFTDIDGTVRCGTFEEYTWKTEWDTLVSVISKDEKLLSLFKKFVGNIKFNKQEAYQYDTFKASVIERFLKGHCSKEIQNEYIEARKKAIKEAEESWKEKPRAIDQLKVNDEGYIEIKPDSEFNQDMFINLRNKTIGINKYIHGVYDRIGAARLEFNWWGSLVMQYHKHLYPGFMKRFRTKGYYNEQTKMINIGSYVAVGRLLSKEYTGIMDRVKNSEEHAVLASIHEVAKATLDIVLNIKTNWNLMPEWERRAAKRALGDLYGVVSAMLMAMAIYAMTDDDDEKESELVATSIYVAQRLISEAQLYTPWGMFSETSVLLSSPLAATNSIEDLLKGLGLIGQWMFDEDFDPNYKTGLYAGQNKGVVLIKRNIPLYRSIERIRMMPKNNTYYRRNQNNKAMEISKAIADKVNPD